MSIKLYYDLMSQPSRAMFILLKSLKVDFKPCHIDMRKGEHLSENYTKLYRLQKMPLLDYKGFVMGESIAMLRFLSKKGVVPDSLYPHEAHACARVDEFLEWQHLLLRLPCAMFFRSAVLEPKLSGTEPDPHRVSGYERRMVAALEVFDQKWLGRGTKFLVGDNVTVADLWAACELEQPRMAGFEPEARFENIGTWLKEVRAFFGAPYSEAHVIVNKIVNQRQRSKNGGQVSKL